MHLLLNITRDDFNELHHQGGPQYIRVLAFNDRGRELLKLMKEKASVPIVNKINQYTPQNQAAGKMLDIDIRATDIYNLKIQNPKLALQQQDFLQSPYYHHNK